MKRFLILAAVWAMLTGCEKKIDLELETSAPLLVVEASIEYAQPPMVLLTKSIGYFSTITPQMLAQSFVHNAEVYISNGTLTHRLKEYGIPLAPGITGYYYSTDSSDLASAFTGELNTSYSLRIVSEGTEYTATTTIPDTSKKIDSLWWKPAPGDDTTKAVVMVRVTDPPGYGDYLRYFTRINNQPGFLPPSFSVYDDFFIDGTSYEVQLQPGIDRNDNSDSTDNDFFRRGDTVRLKMNTIDKATYDFWRTWESAFSSIGNPFSSPTRIMGNLSNNALGYFAGYAVQYRTIIIPQ